MADQIAARSIRASLAQTCLARIVQHRQGTGPDLCTRYRLDRLVAAAPLGSSRAWIGGTAAAIRMAAREGVRQALIVPVWRG